jgi:5-(carboxyamino)imidazole ribonucleotide mutase
MMADVVIIMGSKSDLAHAQAAGDELRRLGLTFEMRVASAHKSPAYLLQMLAEYERQDAAETDLPGTRRVYITIAGRSNALSGMVDAAVTAPVIACPPYGDRFGGADVFSSLRMPSGVAPGLVLEPAGAALLAAKILGRRAQVQELHADAAAHLAADDASLSHNS